MPCRDNRDDAGWSEIQAYKQTITKLEAMLCLIFRSTQWKSLTLGEIDTLQKESGVTFTELEQWWTTHKKKDEERRKREASALERQRKIEAATFKLNNALTQDEKKLLGII